MCFQPVMVSKLEDQSCVQKCSRIWMGPIRELSRFEVGARGYNISDNSSKEAAKIDICRFFIYQSVSANCLPALTRRQSVAGRTTIHISLSHPNALLNLPINCVSSRFVLNALYYRDSFRTPLVTSLPPLALKNQITFSPYALLDWCFLCFGSSVFKKHHHRPIHMTTRQPQPNMTTVFVCLPTPSPPLPNK
jgi:hypothetical protein